MWKWLKSVLVPNVSIKAEPVTINPTTSAREKRNCERCERLRAAIAAGDTRQSLKDELARREKEGR